ncbi:MAG: DUF2236 domain-containing protein [Actinomycetota bacterium]|nr:DUF2236 domain-containing protein [Actinomycetota bacterium]
MTEWLFGPDSMMWRINREAVLLLGGRGALLMQLAHPLVAAGVADHSDFPDGAVARLRRTLETMLAIVFGDVENATRVAQGINSMHRHVVGVAPDGRTYSARDPELMLWVHATLVDSSIRVYEACVAPLTDEELARYYDETKVVADLFEIPPAVVPASLQDLRAWMAQMISSGEVTVTPLARELSTAVLRPVRFVPPRLAEASAFITASLLPAPIREGYGLRIGRPSSAVLAVGRKASRMVLPRLPAVLRLLPAARAAHRRSA